MFQYLIDGLLPWWIAAIFFAFLSACFKLVNQQFKINPTVLMIWRGLGVAIVISPFLLFVSAPSHPLFYIIMIILGLLVAVADRLLFSAIAKFGAGPQSRLSPLAMVLTTLFWWILYPAKFLHLLGSPFILAGIILCLAACVMAVFILKKDKIDREVFLFILPIIILSSIIAILNKTAMSLAPFDQAVVYYIFIQSFVAGSMSLLIYRIKHYQVGTRQVFSPSSIKAGMLIVLFLILSLICKNYSMVHTANPGYVQVINLSVPVWILLFNKIKGVQDKTNIWAGFIFVISAACLILLTR